MNFTTLDSSTYPSVAGFAGLKVLDEKCGFKCKHNFTEKYNIYILTQQETV